MFKLEDLIGQGLYGETIGSNQKIDFSGSPEVLLPNSTLTGVYPSTLVVAASNSLHTGGNYADYTCTGTNDETTINTAIAALPSGGGRVILLEGTYNLGGAIVIAKSNIILEGQGAATILKLANSINTDCIQLGDGTNTYTNIYVKNLLIDGNMANQTLHSSNGVNILANVSFSYIENNIIKNTDGGNIKIGDATASNCHIINNILNTVKAGAGNGNIEGGGNNLVIIGNYCNSGDFDGLDLYQGINNIITNNIINSSTSDGIQIFGVSGSIIANNIILSPTRHGIFIQIGNDIIISENYISNPTNTGIKISDNNNQIINNLISITNNPTGNAIGLGGNFGLVNNNNIQVDSGNTIAITAINITSQHNQINNNTFYFNTAQAHIAIFSGNGDDLVFNGNIISFSSYTAGSKMFDLSGGPFSFTVCNNEGYQAEYGIDCSFAFDGIISGNSFYFVDKGILLTSTTNTIISNNYLYSRDASLSSYGIASVNSVRKDYLNINNNTIERFGQDGISLQGNGYSNISGNQIIDCGQKTTNTYSGIFLTSTGTAYSIYNKIEGNTVTNIQTNVQKYGIRENSVNDGPNVVTGNICLNAATAQISTQNVNTVVANNITA